MEGYCQNCFKIVDMKNISTVKLPNQSFIHRGLCTQPKCDGVVFVKIQDQDLILAGTGHKYPKEIFAADETPKRLLIDAAGQTIIKKDGEIKIKSKDGKIKTVFEVKKESENKNEKS